MAISRIPGVSDFWLLISHALLEMNVSPMQTWRIVQDIGIVMQETQTELEKGIDYGGIKDRTG